jgi:hypothetical protein
MRLTDDDIERMFDDTLEMSYNQIEALLDSLDPITHDRLMERIIGNEADYPRENLL